MHVVVAGCLTTPLIFTMSVRDEYIFTQKLPFIIKFPFSHKKIIPRFTSSPLSKNWYGRFICWLALSSEPLLLICSEFLWKLPKTNISDVFTVLIMRLTNLYVVVQINNCMDHKCYMVTVGHEWQMKEKLETKHYCAILNFDILPNTDERTEQHWLTCALERFKVMQA
jgi:hypothetical protein